MYIISTCFLNNFIKSYCTCVDFHKHPVDTTEHQGRNATFTCVVFVPAEAAVITKPTWVRDMDDVNMTCHIITDNQTDDCTPVYIESMVTVINVTVDDDDGRIYQCGVISNYSNNATLHVDSKCILTYVMFL